MTVTLIALAVVVLFVFVIVQSLALATAAARGDALLRRAVALERRRRTTAGQRSDRRVAA